jgi:hypothetical protein
LPNKQTYGFGDRVIFNNKKNNNNNKHSSFVAPRDDLGTVYNTSWNLFHRHPVVLTYARPLTRKDFVVGNAIITLLSSAGFDWYSCGIVDAVVAAVGSPVVVVAWPGWFAKAFGRFQPSLWWLLLLL